MRADLSICTPFAMGLCCAITGALWLGCSEHDPMPPEPSWTAEFQEGIQGGVMLAAWSNGDELMFSGGTLSTAPGTELGTSGTLLRLQNGKMCRQQIADRPVWWIHGPGPGEFYAVGEAGLILHEQDGVITDESVQTDAILYGVWAGGTGEPIAVGGDPFDTGAGEVWRRENGTWVLLAGDLPGVAFKVWEDWIVGDGVAWQIVDDQLVERFPPNGERLLTVRGRGPDDVWAVGGFPIPEMLHWDGAQWNDVAVDPRCAPSGLNGVWTAPGEDIWIAGFFGGVGTYDGTDWACPDTILTQAHFHAVWEHQGDMWWIGGQLLEPGGNEATIGRFGEQPVTYTVDDCQ